MRHGTCFRRRLSAHHAGAAPHSAVAELGVVRRYSALPMNGRCYPVTPSISPLAMRSEFLSVSPAGPAGPRLQTAASSGFGGASASHRLGVQCAGVLTQNVTPNHALQRTAPCVTAPASAAAFPPTTQVPRRTPLSLSLGSLGVAPRLVSNHASLRVYRVSIISSRPHALAHSSFTSSPSTAFWRHPAFSSFPCLSFSVPVTSSVSTDRRFWSFL